MKQFDSFEQTRYEPITGDDDDDGIWRKIVLFFCFLYRKISY